MSAHVVVEQEIPAGAEVTFDLLHDYARRLEWDTLLRRAYVEGDRPPAQGVVAVCEARRSLGGMAMRTRYVTFRRPELAAVALVAPAGPFERWAASIRHEPLGPDRHLLRYTLTFRCRPRALAPLVEPLAKLAFGVETRRRLRALARAVASPSSAHG